MLKRALMGVGVLIGVYLVVANSTGSGRAIGAGSSAFNSGVKVLQGR